MHRSIRSGAICTSGYVAQPNDHCDKRDIQKPNPVQRLKPGQSNMLPNPPPRTCQRVIQRWLRGLEIDFAAPCRSCCRNLRFDLRPGFFPQRRRKFPIWKPLRRKQELRRSVGNNPVQRFFFQPIETARDLSMRILCDQIEMQILINVAEERKCC